MMYFISMIVEWLLLNDIAASWTAKQPTNKQAFKLAIVLLLFNYLIKTLAEYLLKANIFSCRNRNITNAINIIARR